MRELQLFMYLFAGLMLYSCNQLTEEKDPLVGEWVLFSVQAWETIDGQVTETSDQSSDWKVTLEATSVDGSYKSTSYYKEKSSSTWIIDMVDTWVFSNDKVYCGDGTYDVVSLTEREMVLERHSSEPVVIFGGFTTKEFYGKWIYRKE